VSSSSSCLLISISVDGKNLVDRGNSLSVVFCGLLCVHSMGARNGSMYPAPGGGVELRANILMLELRLIDLPLMLLPMLHCLRSLNLKEFQSESLVDYETNLRFFSPSNSTISTVDKSSSSTSRYFRTRTHTFSHSLSTFLTVKFGNASVSY